MFHGLHHTARDLITEASQLHCRDRDRALHDDDTQWDLRRFPRVCKLRLDVDPLDYNYRLRFRHTPPALQELEMHDHPWPSPMVMQSIAETFPELRVLKLSQNAIWCGLCNTCNVASFNVPPPSPLVYTSGKGLPVRLCVFTLSGFRMFIRRLRAITTSS